MKKYLEFFKTRAFLINFSIAVVAVVVFFWVIFKLLDVYTRHGETVSVPDFQGKKVAQLGSIVHGKNIGYEIIDSVYDTEHPPGTVIRQDPDPGDKVKEGRSIYLYVTSYLPPMISMPRLEDMSLRMAVAVLETYGLKFGGSKEEPGDCNGCIIKQAYKGKRIEPGTRIEKGSVITLVVGKSNGDNSETGVPDITGLSLEEARNKLGSNSLNVGAVIFDPGSDSSSAKVYMQVPSASVENTVTSGTAIDIYLKNE